MTIAIVVALVLAVGLGRQLYGSVSPAMLLLIVVAVGFVIIYLLNQRTKNFSAEIDSLKEKRAELIKIGTKYNKDVKQLEADFRSEKNSSKIREDYSNKYEQIYNNYRAESQAFIDQWNATHSNEQRLKGMWQNGIKTCVIALIAAGGLTMGIKMREAEPTGMAALMESRMWNADNIPMPHMKDATKYVSNPDSILSPAIVDSIDHIMYRLDNNLGIESAVVIVGHIEGDDPIPMIRGIYEKYKVGRNDRGLVIVVGYLDHSYFIAPGRGLEGDLTDMETNHLAQDYLIPSMKAELPDSGMEDRMCLTNFGLLKEKDTVKFVAGSIRDLERAKEIIERYGLIGRCHIYLSPVFGRIQPADMVEFMIRHKLNGVRLQLQLHKFIWHPDTRGV